MCHNYEKCLERMIYQKNGESILMLEERKYGESFTPKLLLETEPRLKLIINLTNAYDGRYYYAEDFTRQGIDVVAIKCTGGPNHVPSNFLLNKFHSTVDEFFNNNTLPNSLIGVHCTHGLNRTGYFICKYMIDKMGIQPQEAIESFQTARGHSMERPLLINDILGDSLIKKQVHLHSPLENCYGHEIPSRSRYRNRRYHPRPY